MRPRTRFCFEAKRLGTNHGVSQYLGIDGLQCFLEGGYAAEDDWAGMLGYVQEGQCVDWAEKIEMALSKDEKKHKLNKKSPWRSQHITDSLASTYRSGHIRPRVGRPIEIYHTLLSFN